MTPRQGRAGALRWLPGLALAAALAVGPAAHAAPGAQAPGAQPAPRWAEQDIRASRSVPAGAAGEATQPPCQADACQLFVVLEREGRQLALLDGARLEVVARLPAGHPVHGEPRFTPDGRHVFLGSQDGWITKLDLWRQRPVAQVRAGLHEARCENSHGSAAISCNQLDFNGGNKISTGRITLKICRRSEFLKKCLSQFGPMHFDVDAIESRVLLLVL